MVGVIVLLSVACLVLGIVAVVKHNKAKSIQKEWDNHAKESFDYAKQLRTELTESKQESGMLRKKLVEQSESMQVLQKLIQQKA